MQQTGNIVRKRSGIEGAHTCATYVSQRQALQQMTQRHQTESRQLANSLLAIRLAVCQGQHVPMGSPVPDKDTLTYQVSAFQERHALVVVAIGARFCRGGHG